MVVFDERTETLPPVSSAVADRDDSTRYLCAAAHLNPDYADAAVAEMLVEPARATAPSPGIDPGAVLTEAIAARVRVRFVAAASLLVAVLLAVLWPAWLVVWVVLAVPVLLMRGVKPLLVRWGDQLGLGGGSRRGAVGRALAAVVIAALVITVLIGVYTTSWELSPLAFLVVLPLLGVLIANRLVVNRLITGRFQRRMGHQPSPSARLGSQLLAFSPPLADMVKQRYLSSDVFTAPSEATAAELVPLVVYRGYDPFVGAGPLHRPWSMAIPLERNPVAAECQTLTTARLLDSISGEIEALRDAGPISPSGRFSRLVVQDVVAIGSDELVEHLRTDEGRPFIKDEHTRPYTHISRERAMALRDNPVEWARFFRRFSVLTWDHDLILSVYLHVAMNDSTLYVEWTPCVLRPIKGEYREIDTRRHGALSSLREFAADRDVRNYFQRLDVDRYLKILHTRAIRAISALLAEAGYLRASLEQQAQAIVQNSVHIGGSMTGPITMGLSNSVGDIKVKGG